MNTQTSSWNGLPQNPENSAWHNLSRNGTAERFWWEAFAFGHETSMGAWIPAAEYAPWRNGLAQGGMVAEFAAMSVDAREAPTILLDGYTYLGHAEAPLAGEEPIHG